MKKSDTVSNSNRRLPSVTTKIMAAIKSTNTKPELVLGHLLWNNGYRYRKQFPIIGKPDFVLVKRKVAIFCDGDFWHGNNWKIRGLNSFERELETYSEFWQKKILTNVRRDKLVNEQLSSQGWIVLRFWESDIIHNPDMVINELNHRLNEPPKENI